MRIYRYVGSFLLGAALIAPAGMLAGTNFQDDHHQDDKHRDRDEKNQRRYYDKNHKDYHTWDDREGRAYQQWTVENHRDNRDFSHLKRGEQSEYWNWRHAHPDGDRGRHYVVSVCCDLSDLALRLARTDGLNQTHRARIGEVLTASSLLATLSSGDTK